MHGELLMTKREAKSKIEFDQNQHPTRSTNYLVIWKMGQNVKSLFKQFRINGRVQSKTIVKHMGFKEWVEWKKKWKPTIKDEEVFKVAGNPTDEMRFPKR